MESPEQAAQKHPGLKEDEHQKEVVESKAEVEQRDPKEKNEEIQSKEEIDPMDPEEKKMEPPTESKEDQQNPEKKYENYQKIKNSYRSKMPLNIHCLPHVTCEADP